MRNDDRPLLMGCTIADLRVKLAAPALADWWAHFLTLARNDPHWFSPYTVLAALVTESDRDRRLAKEAFLRFAHLKPEGDTSLDAQIHTHVTAAPLGRWAIYYDWLAGSGLFTPDEDDAIRSAMLDHALVFPMQNLPARARMFENQCLANAFGATAVGYVFGVRRSDSALGRRLFNDGIAWLSELLDLIPKGGYNPEGSAYHEAVVQPLITLSAALVDETIGLSSGQQQAVIQLLHTSHRMIGPAGLLPACDAYGFQAASVKSGLAYLARQTRDAGPLATIREHGLWYRSALAAWELDDRLWTLVWWPASLSETSGPRHEIWMEPEVGGALQCDHTGLRLFQCWDECGGIARAGRYQVDPNAITLEAYGSPLLLDGSGKPPVGIVESATDDSRAYIGERALETVKEYCRIWGDLTDVDALRVAFDGCIGMSNALVLDGENWYVPREPRLGSGTAQHAVGEMNVIQSESSEFYKDRYDVTEVTRTSMSIGGKYVVVADHIAAQSPHDVTWQAYVRQPAAIDGGRVVLNSPEHVRCDILFCEPANLLIDDVANYPALPDNGSALVRNSVPAAKNVTSHVALVPQPQLEVIADLSGGWTRQIGVHETVVDLRSAYLSDPCEPHLEPRVFRRTLELGPQTGERIIVTLAVASGGVCLQVNGQCLPPAQDLPTTANWNNGRMLPLYFDVTAALKDGVNELRIEAPYFHGESICGPLLLHREITTLPVDFKQTGENCVRVTVGDRTDDIIIDRRGGLAAWLGGETDAAHALRQSNGRVSAGQVTKLRLPGEINFAGSVPCDFEWSNGEFVVHHAPAGCTLDASWGGSTVHIEIGGCVLVTSDGEPFTLRMRLRERRFVIVNGKPAGVYGGQSGQDSLFESAVVSARRSALSLNTAEDVYALAESSGDHAQILAALDSDDWRVQLAAADVSGRLGLTDSIPVLLRLFNQAEAEMPYPVLTKWWRGSKMFRNADAIVGPDTAIDLPLGIKRWRVKRAVVTALGRLGDKRAVVPLEAAVMRGDDFYPVTSQLAVALGRLGSASSIAVLKRFENHAEINTRLHARLSLALLAGHIDRADFESKIGLS